MKMWHPFIDDVAWQQLQQGLRKQARTELLPRFHHAESRLKADGSLITAADHAMQSVMQEMLYTHWPQAALLGEETTVEEQLGALRSGCPLWVLDPLDGTTNFARGFHGFAVSLALLVGGERVLGLVYDPLRDELFSARMGRGAQLNGRPLSLKQAPVGLGQSLALVDFKRLQPDLACFLAAKPPFVSQRNLGSVALDWCWLAAGRGDLYLHGGQRIWDYAAGQFIFSQVGGQSCTLDGSPVFDLSLESRSAVAASSADLLTQWKACVQQFSSGPELMI